MAQTSWRSSAIANSRMENVNFVFPSSPSSSSSTSGDDTLSSSFQLQYGHFLRYWTGIQTETSSSVQPPQVTSRMIATPTTRRVSFSTSVKVILIPSREEFRQAKIFDQVWWNRVTDFAAFKRSACHELVNFMGEHKLECHKEALRLLYQPCGLEEDLVTDSVNTSIDPSSVIGHHTGDDNNASSSSSPPSSSSSLAEASNVNYSSIEQKQEEPPISKTTTTKIALATAASLPTDDIDKALQQACEAATAGALRPPSPISPPPSPPSSEKIKTMSTIDTEFTNGTHTNSVTTGTRYGSPRSIASKKIIASPPSSPPSSPPTHPKQKSCLKRSTPTPTTAPILPNEKIKHHYQDDLALGELHPLALMTL